MYTLDVIPKPAPRPRARAVKIKGKYIATVYNPADYTAYKKDLIFLIRELRIPAGDYSRLDVTFFFAYPKSTPKKSLIDRAKMRKKPDCDNLAKTVADSLEQAGVVHNDSQFSTMVINKLYTTENPRIEFKLS